MRRPAWRASVNRFKWFYHPIFIFVFSIVALAASLALYIYWYIEVSAGLKAVIEKYNLDPYQFLEVQTWVVILVLSILVAIILAGVFLIFMYNQKTWQLYRMQRNFINSFTHELKTPVTSLKLYLETFAKHELPREDRLKYIGFMIQDVERLLDNINRILKLARIESGSYRREFVETDLVSAIRQFCRRNADLFRNAEIRIHNPAGTPLRGSVIPLLFDMFLMNILTNAVKYNKSGAPAVDIRLRSPGEGAAAPVRGQRDRHRPIGDPEYLQKVLPGRLDGRHDGQGKRPGPVHGPADRENPPGKGDCREQGQRERGRVYPDPAAAQSGR